jgi:hypothetical protein
LIAAPQSIAASGVIPDGIAAAAAAAARLAFASMPLTVE